MPSRLKLRAAIDGEAKFDRYNFLFRKMVMRAEASRPARQPPR